MVDTMLRRSGLNMVFVLAACLASQPVLADEEASEILDRVKDRYEEIDDAEIKFTQEVTFARTKLEQKATGKLFLRKENQYRLELNDQIIVTDGETVWSYSRPAEQVIIDLFKIDERILTPEKILTGAPADFSATVLGREPSADGELVVLKMTPAGDNVSVTSLKLWVDEANWLIRRVELIEFSGKKTTYTIKELKSNVGLEAGVFSFTPPEGVEVVDLR